jgi:alkylation response protein AidB-like acyl-CoA dehydrogenase
MNLTEPQAGSDLSTVRTRAEPMSSEGPDGGFALHGQKIYITYGANDLAENTLHLVLARLPDAPPGSRGISLFACLATRPDGTPNAVRCAGIERKLGIHGSPTCTMLFEGAEAELIGQPHRGLPAMFAMMNNAACRSASRASPPGPAPCSWPSLCARREQGGRAIARHPDVARCWPRCGP